MEESKGAVPSYKARSAWIKFIDTYKLAVDSKKEARHVVRAVQAFLDVFPLEEVSDEEVVKMANVLASEYSVAEHAESENREARYRALDRVIQKAYPELQGILQCAKNPVANKKLGANELKKHVANLNVDNKQQLKKFVIFLLKQKDLQRVLSDLKGLVDEDVAKKISSALMKQTKVSDWDSVSEVLVNSGFHAEKETKEQVGFDDPIITQPEKEDTRPVLDTDEDFLGGLDSYLELERSKKSIKRAEPVQSVEPAAVQETEELTAAEIRERRARLPEPPDSFIFTNAVDAKWIRKRPEDFFNMFNTRTLAQMNFAFEHSDMLKDMDKIIGNSEKFLLKNLDIVQKMLLVPVLHRAIDHSGILKNVPALLLAGIHDKELAKKVADQYKVLQKAEMPMPRMAEILSCVEKINNPKTSYKEFVESLTKVSSALFKDVSIKAWDKAKVATEAVHQKAAVQQNAKSGMSYRK